MCLFAKTEQQRQTWLVALQILQSRFHEDDLGYDDEDAEIEYESPQYALVAINQELYLANENYLKLKHQRDKLDAEQLTIEDEIAKLLKIIDAQMKSEKSEEQQGSGSTSTKNSEKTTKGISQTIERSLSNAKQNLEAIIEEKEYINQKMEQLELLIETRQDELDKLLATYDFSENVLNSQVPSDASKRTEEKPQKQTSKTELPKSQQTKASEEENLPTNVASPGKPVIKKLELNKIKPGDDDYSLTESEAGGNGQQQLPQNNQNQGVANGIPNLNFKKVTKHATSADNDIEGLHEKIEELVAEINNLNQQKKGLKEGLAVQKQYIHEQTQETEHLKALVQKVCHTFKKMFPELKDLNPKKDKSLSTEEAEISKGLEKCEKLSKDFAEIQDRKTKETNTIELLQQRVKFLEAQLAYAPPGNKNMRSREESQEGIEILSREINDLKELNKTIYQHVRTHSPHKGQDKQTIDALVDAMEKNLQIYLRVSQEAQANMFERVSVYLREGRQQTENLIVMKQSNETIDIEEAIMLLMRIITDFDHIETEITSFLKTDSQQRKIFEHQGHPPFFTPTSSSTSKSRTTASSTETKSFKATPNQKASGSTILDRKGSQPTKLSQNSDHLAIQTEDLLTSLDSNNQKYPATTKGAQQKLFDLIQQRYSIGNLNLQSPTEQKNAGLKKKVASPDKSTAIDFFVRSPKGSNPDISRQVQAVNQSKVNKPNDAKPQSSKAMGHSRSKLTYFVKI